MQKIQKHSHKYWGSRWMKKWKVIKDSKRRVVVHCIISIMLKYYRSINGWPSVIKYCCASCYESNYEITESKQTGITLFMTKRNNMNRQHHKCEEEFPSVRHIVTNRGQDVYMSRIALLLQRASWLLDLLYHVRDP